MKNSGWVTDISMASSPCRAWPLTWTVLDAGVDDLDAAPVEAVDDPAHRPLVAGMGWALITTTSSSCSLKNRFSPVASRDRADIGSPWEPVEITQTLPGG